MRKITFTEVAQSYFPHASRDHARRTLRLWVQENEQLKSALASTGFTPGKRLITPRQIALIHEYLGEP